MERFKNEQQKIRDLEKQNYDLELNYNTPKNSDHYLRQIIIYLGSKNEKIKKKAFRKF